MLVRKVNKYNVLQCLFDNGPLSQEEIVLKTHLSRPTVLKIVKELLEDSVIIKSGYGEASGGREPMLLDVNETGYYVAGVDFEYPKLHIGIMNLRNQPVAEAEYLFSDEESPENILEKLVQMLDEIFRESGVGSDKLIGIGVGLPGIIDSEHGISRRIERIKNWENIAVKQILEDRYKIPVHIQNDVHMLAALEKELRQDLSDDFIYVSVRSGIGMAVVLNGEIYSGLKGNAGFLGHMTVDINGPECVCGRKGCLEATAGQRPLKRRYSKESGEKLPHLDEIGDFYEFLYQRAMGGDEIADKLLMDAGVHLAYGIANVIKILEIPTVVIEGARPVIDDEKFQNVFAETLKSQLFENINEEISVIPSKANNEMVVKACGNMVIKEFIKKNYTVSDEIDRTHLD